MNLIITNAKDPKYTKIGTIELNIEHPVYGWIPFGATPDDVEAHGRDLYARALAGEFGTIAPYVAEPKPIPQIQQELTQIINKNLDEFAKDRGYQSLADCISYSTSTVDSFRTDANTCIGLRDQTRAKILEIISKIKTGQIPNPGDDYSSLLSQMPPLTWPV